MTIVDIIEAKNKQFKKTKLIKVKMDVYVPDIPNYISNRNGTIYILTGSGGSGKTNLLLNLFKVSDLCKKKIIILYLSRKFIFIIKNYSFEKHD